MVKAITFTRGVLTPSASAASSFSRTARMERPSTESRSHQTRPATSSRVIRANQAYRCMVLMGTKNGGRLMLPIPSGPPVRATQLVATRVKMTWKQIVTMAR